MWKITPLHWLELNIHFYYPTNKIKLLKIVKHSPFDSCGSFDEARAFLLCFATSHFYFYDMVYSSFMYSLSLAALLAWFIWQSVSFILVHCIYFHSLLCGFLHCTLKFCFILFFLFRFLTFRLEKTTGLSMSTLKGNGKLDIICDITDGRVSCSSETVRVSRKKKTNFICLCFCYTFDILSLQKGITFWKLCCWVVSRISDPLQYKIQTHENHLSFI